MDPAGWIEGGGLGGLALFAFCAATVIPVSSELAVIGALELGFDPWAVFVAASVGNTGGAWFDYGLGTLAAGWVERRLNRGATGRRAVDWIRRYGAWSLAGSWLPVLGDPLCLAAGLFRLDRRMFWLLGIGTRVARYALIIGLWVAASVE